MITIDEVAREIEALHVFFVDWFAGACPDDDAALEQGLLSHLAPGFTYIMPGGAVLGRDSLAKGMRSSRGSNADFGIRIADVTLRHSSPDYAIATYVEWQRNAKASKPANNGRLASVVFCTSAGRLQWLHLHETWLPPDVMAGGDYDFRSGAR